MPVSLRRRGRITGPDPNRRPAPRVRLRLGLATLFALTLVAATAAQFTIAPAPAHAGTVGVSARIQGAGLIYSVEGGPYSCVATGNQDDRVTINCPRKSFEAVFEAWVWLEAIPADSPQGTWSFAGWSGCDTTRVVNGRTQCAVRSGAFTLNERQPKAFFVSRTQVKSMAVRHSGMCLDVAYASTADGANVVQGTCWNGANQRWTTRPVGNGFYNIVAGHSGKCLDLVRNSSGNPSTAHAANVVQRTCSGGTSQQWRFSNNRDGFFSVIARHSGMCLDVAYRSFTHAAPVVQATCSGGDNQQWRFK
jgi:hypothetical protein